MAMVPRMLETPGSLVISPKSAVETS